MLTPWLLTWRPRQMRVVTSSPSHVLHARVISSHDASSDTSTASVQWSLASATRIRPWGKRASLGESAPIGPYAPQPECPAPSSSACVFHVDPSFSAHIERPAAAAAAFDAL